MSASADARSTARLAAFRRLRETPWRYVFSISGGGSAFLSDYLSIPGASASFLEGLIPYSPEATNAFLGFRPENYSSERTARLLASAALRRARTLAAAAQETRKPDENLNIKNRLFNVAPLSPLSATNAKTPENRDKNKEIKNSGNFDLSAFSLVGVGATASLVSDRPKRGEHRIFCAVETLFETFSATLTLEKGARDRAAEERLAADFILTVLLFAAENAVDRAAALGIDAETANAAESERSTVLDAANSGDFLRLNAQTTANVAEAELNQACAAARARFSTVAPETANAAESELNAPLPPLSSTAWREFSAPIPPSELLPLGPGDVASISWTTLDAVGSAFLFELDSTTFPRPFPKVAALRFDAGKVAAVRFAPTPQTQERQTQERQTQERQTQERQTQESQDLTTASFRNPLDAPSTAETLYPGSFNPPHRAHRRVAELAAEKTGAPVAFELSVRNVDKPSLDALEISRRLEALQEAAPNVPVWTTNAPRFVEKAALFPGSTFALGTDSVVRLGDAKYENGSTSRRDAVLERLAESGAKFLVFTRKLDGAVQAPESLPLPEKLRTLCAFVPPEEFLDDVSSTALRRKTQNRER
ncbi:MAG: CinA family protein [Thermoguttaceae bacterium]|nr:CinA family protein [Thermoguttaceae bacterium]